MMSVSREWWILVDRDGLIIAGEGRTREELEYFAAVLMFAIVGLRRAIRDEMDADISEISFKVPERGTIFHVLPVNSSPAMFLITAMPDDMPLGMVRLKTKEIYERARKFVNSLKPGR